MFITGIIGYPLKTTFSPALHNSAFEKLRLKGVYLPLKVPASGLKDMVSLIRKLKFNGVNITTPYKTRILEYLDHLDEISEKVGAVNAVVATDENLLGYNTDVYGFDRSLQKNKIDPRGKKVLLIGGGGAARACAFALNKFEPAAFCIANRTFNKARSLARTFNADSADLKNIKNVIRTSDLVINATTEDLQRLVLPGLKPGCTYYDLNYRNRSLKKDRVRIINGTSMLIFQALLSFYLWTKKMPRFSTMAKALKEAYDQVP